MGALKRASKMNEVRGRRKAAVLACDTYFDIKVIDCGQTRLKSWVVLWVSLTTYDTSDPIAAARPLILPSPSLFSQREGSVVTVRSAATAVLKSRAKIIGDIRVIGLSVSVQKGIN